MSRKFDFNSGFPRSGSTPGNISRRALAPGSCSTKDGSTKEPDANAWRLIGRNAINTLMSRRALAHGSYSAKEPDANAWRLIGRNAINKPIGR